ncbi:carbohydrate ABC transporter permease [Actinospica sp. MGRD01-02]|uniref:Carbohydrate ABC transporter permease n=1 Tax=Actinospica acidithermotolerans TaxID=2828514 RepID=A0A941E632_9ACTN|nr:carbohydrate ABC transporter permease [Actinospica acidithermotolerans]MBR7825122.1 carbohydrate ABC transporter permease [Actinospica acidithermotolerans]
MSSVLTTPVRAGDGAKAPAPRNRPGSRRRALRSRISAAGLLLVTLVLVAPIILAIKVSLQSDADASSNPLGLPHHLDWANYSNAFQTMDYGRSVFNSVLITGCSALVVLLTGSLCAWPLARLSRAWTKIVYQFFVAGLTIPVFVLITPLYILMRNLHLLDSFASVILSEAAISLPFAVLFFTSFLRSVPAELEEAAAIDGAGPLRTYWHVVLPLLRPASATLIITLTLAIWNDLIIPLVMLSSDNKQTITLDVYNTIGTHSYSASQLLPTVLLGTAPLLVVFVILQRHIVAGISAGVGKD